VQLGITAMRFHLRAAASSSLTFNPAPVAFSAFPIIGFAKWVSPGHCHR
jgi:hypothetical protein